jgi:hypothetical protein
LKPRGLSTLCILISIAGALGSAPASAAGHQSPAPLVSASEDPWSVYDRGFAALVAGCDSEASPLFTWVTQHPDHPAAPYAAEMLRWMEARPIRGHRPVTSSSPEASARPLPSAPSLRGERPSDAGRTILALGQTLNGLSIGAEMCIRFGCRSVVASLGAGAGLGAVGLASSLLLSRQGVTLGQGLLLTDGPIIGLANGALLAAGGSAHSEPAGGLLAFGQIGGTVVSSILGSFLRPSAGDVFLATSTGLWFMGFATTVRVAAAPYGVDEFPEMLAALDLGLVLGALIAWKVHMSVAHVLILDGGWLAGAVIGSVVGLGAIASEASNPTLIFAGTAGGSVVGLIMTAAIVRNWDVPQVPVPTPTLMPTSTGGVTPGLAFRF